MTDETGVPVLGEAIPRRGTRLSEAFGRAVLALLGWRVTGEFPNAPKLVMIGAPHTSNCDFVVALSAAFSLRLGFSWVGKHVLFRPPLDRFFRWLGGVPVDRRSSHGFVQQMVGEFDRRQQFLLAIAPEGTRKAVTRLKTGFYHIALGAKVRWRRGTSTTRASARASGFRHPIMGSYCWLSLRPEWSRLENRRHC